MADVVVAVAAVGLDYVDGHANVIEYDIWLTNNYLDCAPNQSLSSFSLRLNKICTTHSVAVYFS